MNKHIKACKEPYSPTLELGFFKQKQISHTVYDYGKSAVLITRAFLYIKYKNNVFPYDISASLIRNVAKIPCKLTTTDSMLGPYGKGCQDLLLLISKFQLSILHSQTEQCLRKQIKWRT